LDIYNGLRLQIKADRAEVICLDYAGMSAMDKEREEMLEVQVLARYIFMA
jgi:Asp/Glu/hydantoin racemase